MTTKAAERRTKDEGRKTNGELVAQVNALRAALRAREPHTVASNAGVEFDAGVYRFKFYGEPYRVTVPDLEVIAEATNKASSPYYAAMFLYYLHTADGTPRAGKWISFRELPDGMFYHQAYQGYSGNRLVKVFGNRVDAFEHAARQLGGMKLTLGDAAYAFDALPRVQVAAVYYAGDDDFPATANVLFDASASHYLPTDVLASIGRALVDRLMRVASRNTP